MKISRETLLREAAATGFRADVLEKVIHLLGLLEALRSHPFLKERLALKGGTALNLFLLELPRLSVDIDLNYVGAARKEAMTAERPKVEAAVQAVCTRQGFTVRRLPVEHAGGKWSLRYQSASGQGGNLEVDLNFMFRVPLWPVVPRDSQAVGSHRACDIPLVDIHELAAGKLVALLARGASRDLFDAHRLLTGVDLDSQRLRLAFVTLGAMNRLDWRTVSAQDVEVEDGEFRSQLLPVLRTDFFGGAARADEWARRLVEECRTALGSVLPFSESELEFLDRLLDYGEIAPSVLTADEELADRIRRHPLLEWKAFNVREHRQRLGGSSPRRSRTKA